MNIPSIRKGARGVASPSVCATLLLAPTARAEGGSGNFCPQIYRKGELNLDFNPAFVEVDEYKNSSGGKADGLTVSSFYNAYIIPGGTPPGGPGVGFFERDLVARIPEVGALDTKNFDPSIDLEVLTDTFSGQPKTVWPNEAHRAPDGVFPFEAVVIPQGFLSAGRPGRLTAVNIDDPTLPEYIIHQSTLDDPWFYHRALYMDVDMDELVDIVTVRSSFLIGPDSHPPFGDLVWFKNPGGDLFPSTPWEETVLYGGIAVGFLGPDISLVAHDFDGDNITEIVATHYFTASPFIPGGPPLPTAGKISIYGPPPGKPWTDVNAWNPARTADISTDQGFPFNIEIIDLNRDDKMDILATNHQPDGCTPITTSPIPGRVYGLEQPKSGDLFKDAWTTHILLDDIYPQPSLPGFLPPGRLAPSRAHSFHPKHKLEKRPWIMVCGGEASKVWLLQPRSNKKDSWDYKSAVVFDINHHYGPGTTQKPLLDPFGITISTIDEVAVRYDEDDWAEIYIPVFEGKDIHILSFNSKSSTGRVECVEDTTIDCPTPPS